MSCRMLEFESPEVLREKSVELPDEALKKLRIVYMGSPEFACPPLTRLVRDGWNITACATQPDRPVGRRQVMTPPPLKMEAERLGIAVWQWESLRAPEAAEAFMSLKPDLVISSAYGLIVPQMLLEAPAYGCLNIHPSLLPLYRGASPIQACLLHGDCETAVSIMKMEKGLDTGDVIAACRYPIGNEINAEELDKVLSELSAELLVRVLPLWIRGEICGLPQDHAQAVLTKKLCREDGCLDFTQSAKENADRIRACYGWPGAYTFLDGKKYKIHKARALDEQSSLPPGTISEAGKCLKVACAKGCLELLVLQLPSGKTLEAKDCAHNFKVGQRFSREGCEGGQR